MSTSQKVFFKNIFGNPVCCVLRTRKLRSKLVGSIICEANYPEGARTARIGEANQASECKCAKNLSITETLTVKYVMFYRCGLWVVKQKNNPLIKKIYLIRRFGMETDFH